MRACIFALILIPGVLLAQVATYRDKGGNMSLKNFTSWRISPVKDKLFTFHVAGSPLEAEWKDRGLTVFSSVIDGKLEKNVKNAFELRSAVISGGVKAIVKTQDEGSDRTSTVNCDEATYDGGTSTAVLKGKTTVVSIYPADDQTVTLTGSGATIELEPLGKKTDDPLRSGEILGPVTMKLVTLRRDPQKKEPPKKIVVNGRCKHLTFNNVTRKITLTGNVFMDGDDQMISGEVTAIKAVITLNAKHEIVDIEFSGAPGQSVISPPPVNLFNLRFLTPIGSAV